MKDMLFSASPITDLNQLVQSKLASHLFLCCNYNPLPGVGLSDDGKYYPAITNLYRIVSDCSCIIKHLSKFEYPIASIETAKKLNRSIGTINMLRSVVAHNNSRNNGRREAERLDDYHCWVQRIIGKSEPNCSDDYSALLKELRVISNDLYDTLEEYILLAATHNQKDLIINEWESCIIDWYCGKNVKRDIFLGVLEDEYLARVPLTNLDNRMHYRVARWIKNYYTNETQLEKVRKLAASIEDPNVHARINQMQIDIEELCASTCEQYKSDDPYCFVDRFFEELKDHLTKTLEQEKCSMLPEDLLQRQIQILFDPVSIPDVN